MMTPNTQSGCAFGQAMVDQGPRFDGATRRRRGKPIRQSQVIGKAGIIRPDKRKKAKYL